MASSDATQVTIAAFVFGILLEAASGAFLLYFYGHGWPILKDGRGLALMVFLSSAALWALMEFINLVMPSYSTSACQATLVFSVSADQVARVAIEQFMLWSISQRMGVNIPGLILQAVLALRFIMGGVLVGFSRPGTTSTCVAHSSLLAVPIIVLGLDVFVMGALVVQGFSVGLFGHLVHTQSTAQQELRKRVVMTLSGLALWTGTSVAMLLGVSTIALLLKTALPAVGLLVLIGIVATFSGTALTSEQGQPKTIEARSPLIQSSELTRELSRGINDRGSLINDDLNGNNLFVVNPSLTPAGSLTPMSEPATFPGTPRAATGLTAPPKKKSRLGWSQSAPRPDIRNLSISNPVMIEEPETSDKPKIQTIDLKIAAAIDRERREETLARSRLIATRPAPQPPSIANGSARTTLMNAKLNESLDVSDQANPLGSHLVASSLNSESWSGSSTSASLSPGHEEVRRRSPRHMSSFEPKRNMVSSARLQVRGLPARPKPLPIVAAETVFSVQDTTPDNTAAVRTIIQKTIKNINKMEQADRDLQSTTDVDAPAMKHTDSIIHRPRPYKHTDRERQSFFPSDSGQAHRRTKSGPSYLDRDAAMLVPRVPPALPLPRGPPVSAKELRRLLPNNTHSMTFNEKIQLLFPAPPGSTIHHNRRSSVPSLSRPSTIHPSEELDIGTGEDQSYRASKRSSTSLTIPEFRLRKSSVASAALLEPEVEKSRLRADSHVMGDILLAWLPLASPTTPTRDGEDSENKARQSTSTESTYDDVSTDSALNTDWGSIHSEIPPVDLSQIRQNARHTFIQSKERQNSSDSIPQISQSMQPQIVEPLLMDPQQQAVLAQFQFYDESESSMFDDDAVLMDEPSIPVSMPAWHRRIGDELPSFSERKNSGARKMPPPTPLRLHSTVRRAPVVIQHSEPSPVESPERAIREIQDQLRHFEEANRGSVGSLLTNLPGKMAQNVSPGEDDRLRLLENLEAEMGQQENLWQTMHNNFDVESNYSASSSQRSSRVPSTIISRRERVRSNLSIRSQRAESNMPIHTRNSETGDNPWQIHAVPTQQEYMDSFVFPPQNQNVNLLSASSALGPLGSPTPPDTDDSESDLDSDSECGENAWEKVLQLLMTAEAERMLWQPQPRSPIDSTGPMWSSSSTKSNAPDVFAEPPAMRLRPTSRSNFSLLTISSSSLWEKPHVTDPHQISNSLWGGWKLHRRKSAAFPRVSQRPARKQKRITYLPDIVESPKPLPDKRDTLGYFQFAWGETSDSAVYQPKFDPTLLARPVVNVAQQLQSQDLDPDLDPDFVEYSSSFFDDYDEDQEMDSDYDIDSDDDFDESTLWDIARILKSEDVPTKDSLLPSSSQQIIEDYDDESDVDVQSESEAKEAQNRFGRAAGPMIKLPIERLSIPPKTVAHLWITCANPALPASIGLPQPDIRVWQAYTQTANDFPQTRSHSQEPALPISSYDLWALPVSGSLENSRCSNVWEKAVWSMPSASGLTSKSAVIADPSSMLWVARSVEIVHHSGLFSVSYQRLNFRTTDKTPAARDMNQNSRPSTAILAKLTSHSLWTRNDKPTESVNWILRSIRSVSTTSSSKVSKLWTPKASVTTITHHEGLFKVTGEPSRRTTDIAPAAVDMVCAPRQIPEAMSKLDSSNLWAQEREVSIEHHWISESSVRPLSPSTCSDASSGRSSPISDASSAVSVSTAASSFWNSSRVGAWWDSRSTRSSRSNSSNSIEARKPSSITTLPSVRESRVLASRDMWEAMATKDSKPILKETTRRQSITAVATKTSPRPSATKADWTAALTDAIAKGQPKFERPAASSEMWKQALNEALGIYTPAAIENAYDSSVLHPIFFTSNMTSSTKDIHPAALGYVQMPVQDKLMWEEATSILMAAETAPESHSGLWKKSAVAKLSVPIQSAFDLFRLNQEPRPKTVPRTESLAHLNSKELFQLIANKPESEMDWLAKSSYSPPRPSLMWAIASPLTPASYSSGTSLWSKTATPTVVSKVLSHLASEDSHRVKKVVAARDDALPSLTSTELFISGTARSEKEVNWLYKSGGII